MPTKARVPKKVTNTAQNQAKAQMPPPPPAPPAAPSPPPGAPGAQAAPPAASGDPVMDQIRQQYGYLAAFLDIPEVGDVIRQASKEQWSNEKLLATLENTNWWKSHTATERQWTALKTTDPAEAQGEIQKVVDDINAKAQQLGISIDPGRVSQIAEDAKRFGFTDQELKNAVAGEYHYNPNKPQGTTVQGLQQLARQYLVPLAPQTLQTWTQQIMSGQQTQDGFTSYLRDQAGSLYPAMSDALARGTTPDQYVDPYRQIAAKELEINPNQVDFMDAKWNKAINQIDPKTNQRVPMSLSDWTNEIRSNSVYGFDYTNNARTQAAQMETQLLQKMGALG